MYQMVGALYPNVGRDVIPPAFIALQLARWLEQCALDLSSRA